jgi:hypothetical protein
MPYVVEMPLDDGDTVLIEVGESDESGIGRVSRADEVAAKATDTLQAALGRVRPAIQAVVAQLRDGLDPPDKLTLQFGIKITAEVGVVVAKAATEANFTVTAEWAGKTTG